MKPLSPKQLLDYVSSTTTFGREFPERNRSCIIIYRDLPFMLVTTPDLDEWMNNYIDASPQAVETISKVTLYYVPIHPTGFRRYLRKNGSMRISWQGLRCITTSLEATFDAGSNYYVLSPKRELSIKPPLRPLIADEENKLLLSTHLDISGIAGSPVFSANGTFISILAGPLDNARGNAVFDMDLLRTVLDAYLLTKPHDKIIRRPRKRISAPQEVHQRIALPKDEDPLYPKNMLKDVSFIMGGEPPYTQYPVLYGTSRNAFIENGKLRFGKDRGQELSIGNCIVSIPPDHKIGVLERPSWFRRIFFDESPERHFTILSNEKLEKDIFEQLLRERLSKAEENDILLFIHGYNVSFDEAIMRAAQLGQDLSFPGVVTAYSWPSRRRVSSYVSDLGNAEWGAIHLCNFIELLLNREPSRLHIVAHSMGNLALSYALLQLKERNRFPSERIQQIVFAAPDVDQDLFSDRILPQLINGPRLTLYASEKDRAIIWSRRIRNNYKRMGDGGSNLAVLQGLESIDASQVDTSWLGHGYFADTQELIHDIHSVLQGVVPDKRLLHRRLKAVNGNSLPYWLFL